MRAHNHDDVDRITFGCDGCIARAEQARIDNAPLRLCVWHCDYWADVSPEHRSLTFARKVRVPTFMRLVDVVIPQGVQETLL